MSHERRNRLLVISSSLFLGSVVAISEILLGKTIDSFLPAASIVTSFRRPGSITLLSTNQKVIQKLGPAIREKVASGKMPLLVKKAFVAAEDRRFYEHKGVDLWGISRALVTNFQQKKIIVLKLL